MLVFGQLIVTYEPLDVCVRDGLQFLLTTKFEVFPAAMSKPSSINPLSYVIRRQYSDSLVIKNKLFKERLKRSRNLYRKDLLAHYGCVNAIEFSEEGELLVSGGDDRRVLLWSVPEAIYGQGVPMVMQTNHTSNIFCLAFDKTNSKIFSGGNDDQVIVHDAKTGQMVVKLPHRNPVYGLSINPQNDYILSTAGDDGRILIFDIRESTPDPLCLVKQNSGFHSVVFHPTNQRLLVTANAEEGIALWDCRKMREELIHYDKNAGKVSGISACFDSTGNHVLALRRRLPPVLYATQNPNALCQFYHPQYYNSCTMKTCSFAGEQDEYVLSGSDDFNLYMWKIPEENCEWGQSHAVLHGHRSIVNQVRYNKHNNLIASSGVEKMVKLWSTLPIGTWTGSLLKENNEPQRSVYSRDDYNTIIGPSTPRISHDYSDQSTHEDLRMMAFFDSLIQTEIQGWESSSEETFTSDSDSDRQVQENIRLSWQSLLRCRKTAEENSRKHKPNKIAQLIAQKRNKLAKMAHWKSSTLVQRYSSKERHRKRKNTFKLKSNNNHKFRKNNGLASKNTLSKRITRSASSAHASRSERDNLKRHKSQPEAKKYRTRSQSLLENNNSNNSFDVPSTSTGITGTNASLYRVVEQDSDEDVPSTNCNENSNNSEGNFVNIIPTPLNGSHDMYINMLEVTNGNTNGNVVTLRNEEYASTSSTSRTHSLQCESEEDYNDSFENFVNEDTYLNDSSFSESDQEYSYTPVKRRRRNITEIDSGFATGSCSSNGYLKRSSRNNASCSTRSSNVSYNDHSSDDECHFEKFKRRVKKARINIRKQIGGDSDSN